MLLGMEGEESSECSSGCQSGWTMYLDHSYEPLSTPPPPHYNKATTFLEAEAEDEEDAVEEEEEEEEEDLSMVSDASSGPPHFHEEEPHNNICSSNYCYCYFCCNGNAMCACSASTAAAAAASALANNGGKKRRIVELEHKQREVSSLMDDTASSPLFNLPKTTAVENAVEFSSAFSATHFKGKPTLPKHSYCMQSSSPVKASPTRPGERWKDVVRYYYQFKPPVIKRKWETT